MPTQETDLLEHRYPIFFTATILNWQKLLAPQKYKILMLDSLRFLVEKNRIQVYAFVLMPNHIHLLWRILPPFTRLEVQRDFLKFTAQQIKKDLTKNHPKVLPYFRVDKADRKYQFWQRNPLSVYCYTPQMTEQKLNYIHHNPIQEKWNLASLPEDYPFSSAKFYLKNEDAFGFLTHYLE